MMGFCSGEISQLAKQLKEDKQRIYEIEEIIEKLNEELKENIQKINEYEEKIEELNKEINAKPQIV
jgi:flagellar hook-associated protein FlgK